MNFNYFLFSILIASASLSAMEQPNKKQKTNSPAQQPVIRNPLSLRSACISYLAKEEQVHNETMGLLFSPDVDDQMKYDIINQLDRAFIKNNEENLIDLIKQNTLLPLNQQLLISKLDQDVINRELSDFIKNPLSLRNACVSYINRNITAQPRVQNDTMVLLADPMIADQQLKKDIIEQLTPEFMREYETNLIELIVENQLSINNQLLLITKFDKNVIDDQLGSLIFKSDRDTAIRVLITGCVSDEFIQANKEDLCELFYNKTNTPHQVAGALLTRIDDLQTMDNIEVLAKEGTITKEIADIAARSFVGKHIKKNIYQQDMLDHGNEQHFKQAHYECLMKKLSKFIIIAKLKEAKFQDCAQIKHYGSNEHNYQVDINATTGVTVTQNGAIVCRYHDMPTKIKKQTGCLGLLSAIHLVALDPSHTYAAIAHNLPQHPDLQELVTLIDIVRIKNNKRLMTLRIMDNHQFTNIAWSEDGKRIIVSNEDNTICKNVSVHHKLLTGLLDLKHILYNRFALLTYNSLKIINLKENAEEIKKVNESPDDRGEAINKIIDETDLMTYKTIKRMLEDSSGQSLQETKQQAQDKLLKQDFSISSREKLEAIVRLVEKIEECEKEDQ